MLFLFNLIVLIIIISNLYCLILAQPSSLFQIGGNLNSIDSIAIKKCVALKKHCNFNSIIIDSTTDLK